MGTWLRKRWVVINANVKMYGVVAAMNKATQFQNLTYIDMSTKNSKTEQPCTIHSVIAPLVIGCLTITPFWDDDYMRITIEGVYEDQTELIHKKHLQKLQNFFNGL